MKIEIPIGEQDILDFQTLVNTGRAINWVFLSEDGCKVDVYFVAESEDNEG